MTRLFRKYYSQSLSDGRKFKVCKLGFKHAIFGWDMKSSFSALECCLERKLAIFTQNIILSIFSITSLLRYFRKFLSQSPHDARKLKVIKLAFKQNIVGRNQICRSCVTMRVFIKSVATYVHYGPAKHSTVHINKISGLLLHPLFWIFFQSERRYKLGKDGRKHRKNKKR